jgi:hypothetical protein
MEEAMLLNGSGWVGDLAAAGLLASGRGCDPAPAGEPAPGGDVLCGVYNLGAWVSGLPGCCGTWPRSAGPGCCWSRVRELWHTCNDEFVTIAEAIEQAAIRRDDYRGSLSR